MFRRRREVKDNTREKATYKKRREYRRRKSKVVRDLSLEFLAQLPNDSAIGSASTNDMEQQHAYDIATSCNLCSKTFP